MQEVAAKAIVAGLHDADVKIVASVPEGKLIQLVAEVESDPGFTSVPLCREEEGVGVVAGAYLGGKRAVLIAMSAGFLTCPNALVTVPLAHQMPMPMLIGYSGGFSEQAWLHTPLGLYTEPVLRSMGIPYLEVSALEDAGKAIGEVVSWSYTASRPAALLLNRELLR